MDLGCGGEVADFYHQYRRGYPPAVIDMLARARRAAAEQSVTNLAVAPHERYTEPVRVRMLLGRAGQA